MDAPIYPAGEINQPKIGADRSAESHKRELKMSKVQAPIEFTVLNPHAGGIDVGSRSHWVSTGCGEGQSKEFGVFTKDLHSLCQWVKAQGVKTIAMESTGFYWKQLFVMLQSYEVEVYLVNASYTKNIRGRKPSDLSDSQWIWKMHSVGLFFKHNFQRTLSGGLNSNIYFRNAMYLLREEYTMIFVYTTELIQTKKPDRAKRAPSGFFIWCRNEFSLSD